MIRGVHAWEGLNFARYAWALHHASQGPYDGLCYRGLITSSQECRTFSIAAFIARLFVASFRSSAFSMVTPFDCLLVPLTVSIIKIRYLARRVLKGAIIYICCSLYLTTYR